MDSFSHELTVMAYTILEIEPPKKKLEWIMQKKKSRASYAY